MASDNKEILRESFYSSPDKWTGRIEISQYGDDLYFVYTNLDSIHSDTLANRESLERLRDGLTSFLEKTKA